MLEGKSKGYSVIKKLSISDRRGKILMAKEIILKQLILKNFKGIKSLTINFGKNVTNVKGDNGEGKTTIFDAFNWLLFDKNSSGSKNFEIKTLDDKNNAVHMLEHEVQGILMVGCKELALKKVYSETWTRKRGCESKEMTAHSTDYFIDGTPKKKSEYEKYITSMVDEVIFKLITDPMAFNKLPWKEQRNKIHD